MNLIITEGLAKNMLDHKEGGEVYEEVERQPKSLFNCNCLWDNVKSVEFLNDFFGLASNSA